MSKIQQLKFNVAFCSSSQAGFEAQLLEQNYRESLGWKSQKFPLYPIEIIIRYEDPLVSLAELQFLVDTKLKPYKIDIYSYSHAQQDLLRLQNGDQASWNGAIDLRKASFKYLGEIKFGAHDNNVMDRPGNLSQDFLKMMQSDQRELKSIYLSKNPLAQGAYEDDFSKVTMLKFQIHKTASGVNQSDPFQDGLIDETNPFNQVGILALNNLGVPLLQNPASARPLDPNLTLARFEDQLVYDDFILQRIEELKARQNQAVAVMDFERAQKYKSMVQLLENLGKRLREHHDAQLASIKLGQGHKTEQQYRKDVDALMTMLRSVNVDDVDVREVDFLRQQDKQRRFLSNASKKQDLERDRLRGTITKKDSMVAIM